jgi:6-phosphogluconolactonase
MMNRRMSDARDPSSSSAGDVYGFADDLPAAPPLPGEVRVAPDFDTAVDQVAAQLVAEAERAVREREVFHLAVTGGRVLETLYERLMYDPDFRRLPWRNTHVWFAEERCVPLDDEQSNYQQLRQTIGDHSDIPPEQFHALDATVGGADANYEQRLRDALQQRAEGRDQLDYVLLHLHADGQIAGLAPFSSTLNELSCWVRRTECPSLEPRDRITMTLAAINSARAVSIFATGMARAEAIHRIAYGNESIDQLPAKGVHPASGELHWHLDADACRPLQIDPHDVGL